MERLVFDNGELISVRELVKGIMQAFDAKGADLEIRFESEAGVILISQPPKLAKAVEPEEQIEGKKKPTKRKAPSLNKNLIRKGKHYINEFGYPVWVPKTAANMKKRAAILRIGIKKRRWKGKQAERAGEHLIRTEAMLAKLEEVKGKHGWMERLGLKRVSKLSEDICWQRVEYLKHGLKHGKYKSDKALEEKAKYYANWYAWLGRQGGQRKERQ